MEDNCVRLDFKICSAPVKAAIIAFAALLAGHTIAPDSPVFRNLGDFDRVRAKFAGVSMTFPAVDGYPAVTFPSEKTVRANKRESEYPFSAYDLRKSD